MINSLKHQFTWSHLFKSWLVVINRQNTERTENNYNPHKIISNMENSTVVAILSNKNPRNYNQSRPTRREDTYNSK